MSKFVLNEVAEPFKLKIAIIASEWSLTRMSPLVFGEFAAPCTLKLAFVAGELKLDLTHFGSPGRSVQSLSFGHQVVIMKRQNQLI